MPPHHGKFKVEFGLKLVQESSERDEEEGHCYGCDVEANHDVFDAGNLVAQACIDHSDEGGDASSDTDHREVDIEDVDETDLCVLTAGDEKPDIKPEAKNNNCQQTDCEHEEDDMDRMRACYEKFGPVDIPKGNVK